MTVGRAFTRTGALLAVSGIAAVLGFGGGSAGALPSGAARTRHRVLILSLPTLTWQDLDDARPPTLSRFLARAAIADLATRADRQPARLGAAYVTIGAGTRAAGDTMSEGDALEASEPFGNSTAGDVYEQRTGRPARSGIVDLGIARIESANEDLLYDAQPGELGDTLARAGYRRAVIANGDGVQPDTPPGGTSQYVRPAVGALMGSRGRLPHGVVGRRLLRRDSTAPFGVRLDPSAVERAFADSWRDRSVVLVEASDLLRADRYTSFASTAGGDRQRRRAIRWSDAIARRLLSHVDLARDTVVVAAPSPASGDRSTTIAALRGPGVDAGLLRSGTTRRAGFVTLADVAPTVLGALGVDPPDRMEGRPMTVGRQGGAYSDRTAFLITANDDGLLRDRLVKGATLAVTWTAAALAIAAALLLGRVRWVAEALRWVALAVVGLMLATLVVSALHLGEHGGVVMYWVFVSSFAVLFAAACRQLGRSHILGRWHILGRSRTLAPLFLAFCAFLAVSVVDQLTGAHLELNSVFGYSPTVGVRFAGIGNGSSAQLTAAAVIVAALLVALVHGRRGTRAAFAVLAISFLALTPPLFGQDFGGTLAAAPAFLALAWLLVGRRITGRSVVLFVGALFASGLIVGFLDLLRPRNQRTHVGRFFEKVNDEGLSGFATVLHRKGGENAATLNAGIYLAVIAVVAAALVILWLRSPRALQLAADAWPTLPAAAVAIVILSALGYALNDSGVAVPAITLAAVAPAAVYVAADALEPAPPSQPTAPS